jgi:hypothetical protein
VLNALAWSAPRFHDGGDFAPEDPLAVDYIGQQLGNRLWPGFTTRTSRAFYYVVVCYGLRVAERLLQAHGLASQEEQVRAWFLRWEKLWALAVCAAHDGAIPPVDAMRGLRGVTRAWRARGNRLPLDYQLISRQVELAGLGAYLTSLREHRLVAATSLRLTPVGVELANRMWGNSRRGELDAFVARALEPGRVNAPERVGRVTLRSLGQQAGLSVIRRRPDLQTHLGHLLLDGHPPPPTLRNLPEMARHLAAACADEAHGARTFLTGVLASRWGAPSPAVAENARVAIVFGDVASEIRAVFDRAYRHVAEAGLRAPLTDVAAAALPDEARAQLARCLSAYAAAPAAARILRSLPVHGQAFASALADFDTRRPVALVERLLTFHRDVQRARGKSGVWLRLDGNLALLELAGYRTWHLDGAAWVVGYKQGTMTELLRDLGRVA